MGSIPASVLTFAKIISKSITVVRWSLLESGGFWWSLLESSGFRWSPLESSGLWWTLVCDEMWQVSYFLWHMSDSGRVQWSMWGSVKYCLKSMVSFFLSFSYYSHQHIHRWNRNKQQMAITTPSTNFRNAEQGLETHIRKSAFYLMKLESAWRNLNCLTKQFK